MHPDGAENPVKNSSSERSKPSGVLIVAGGTGGHISPGIGIAVAFCDAGIPVTVLSLEKNRETPDFKSAPFRVVYYDAPPFSGGVRTLVTFPFRLFAPYRFARRLIRTESIGAVIGMGGYSVFPALLAALRERVAIYLCEQNAVPGRVTLFFAKYAKKIFLTFPDATGAIGIKTKNTVMTGNPLRRELEERARRFRERGDRPSGKAKRLLVVGGSQGAVQLNEMVAGCVDRFNEVYWEIQCGEKNIAQMEIRLADALRAGRVHLFGYHAALHELYETADLMICRSGAGVLTEAAAFSLPMVLVPYPYAADNHQKENAEYYARNGAAVILDTKQKEPELLYEVLAPLLGDAARLEAMRNGSAALARLGVAQAIVAEVTGDRGETA